MSKTNILPPNTSTRLQLPDVRLSGSRLTQNDRLESRNSMGKGRPFGRVGDIGPSGK